MIDQDQDTTTATLELLRNNTTLNLLAQDMTMTTELSVHSDPTTLLLAFGGGDNGVWQHVVLHTDCRGACALSPCPALMQPSLLRLQVYHVTVPTRPTR